MPPPSEMWLFLIRMPSERSRRWLAPRRTAPHIYPARAAPETVFRVRATVSSFRRAVHPHSDASSSQCRAHALHQGFRITRSQASSTRALCGSRRSPAPFARELHRIFPEWLTISYRCSGPLVELCEEIRNLEMHPIPSEMTHSCFARTVAVARISGSMVRAVVVSLVPCPPTAPAQGGLPLFCSSSPCPSPTYWANSLSRSAKIQAPCSPLRSGLPILRDVCECPRLRGPGPWPESLHCPTAGRRCLSLFRTAKGPCSSGPFPLPHQPASHKRWPRRSS